MNPGDSVKFDEATNTIHIKKTDGVRFRVAGKTVDGDIKIDKTVTVRAYPRGRVFDEDAEREWVFSPSGSNEPDDSGDDDSTQTEESKENEVEDTPPAPTAGSTPQSPQQATGGPNVPPTPGPRPPRP